MQDVKQTRLNGPKVSVPLILFVSLLLTLPIYINGIPRGNDLPQHFQFALTFFDSLQAGDPVPSLGATANHGFGDVGVRFYPPLSYLVLAGLRIVVGSWHEAATLAFGLWFFLGGLGIYLWSRERFSEGASVAAAFVYMIAPYHVNELYNASLFAEFAAAGILPFCFWLVSRLCRSPDRLSTAGLAVAYALLVLTHLPTAILGSVGLVVFALASLTREKWMTSMLALASAVGGGVLLSGYYLVRMATELEFVNHTASRFVEKAYDFRLNFIASYLYLPAEAYNDGSQWFGDMLALTAFCLFVPSLVFFLAYGRPGSRSMAKGIIAVFIVGVFFATPLSAPVWENLPMLQKIQFPYRWLVLINLAGAAFVAAGFQHVSAAFASRHRPFALAAAGLGLVALAFTAAQVIRPAIYIPEAEAEAYVAGLSAQPSYECWWAVWADEKAFADRQQVSDLRPSGSMIEWSVNEKRFQTGAEHPASARLGLFFYPHWKAEVNGTPSEVSAGEHGSLAVRLPEGPATVRVFFEEPAAVRTAEIVSAVAWLAGLASLLFLLTFNLQKYVHSYTDRKPV